MAGKTAHARLLCAQFVEADDLGDVSAAIHMRLTRPVTAFASLPLRTLVLCRFGSPVRAVIVAVALRLVTRLACICPNV
jgi:hypothetical protein